MKRITALLSAVLVLLVTLWACGPESSPDRDRGDPAAALDALSRDGWALYDTVLRFTPDSLYEQINGRAELYLSYDVLSLTYAAFDHATDPGLSIGFSIYDMGNPLDAFGIYSVERSPGEDKIDLGREAYRSNANYYIWQGRYYITAVSTDPGEESGQVGLDWAQQLVASLPDSGETVPGVDLLPETDLITDSVRYFKVDAMGLDFMPNTFTAQYRGEGGPVTVFVSQAASPDAAHRVMNQYREFAERYGRGTDTTTFDDVDFLVCDMGESIDVVATKGNTTCGVTAAADRDQALRQAAEIWHSLP
jgi:hypothetical protein